MMLHDERRRRTISTHSLLAEGDAEGQQQGHEQSKFQPTPSSRRETRTRHGGRRRRIFQPTPSSRRETIFA